MKKIKKTNWVIRKIAEYRFKRWSKELAEHINNDLKGEVEGS